MDIGTGFAAMKMNDLAAVRLQRMPRIHLCPGTGDGRTPRAAFDSALRDAGAAGCDRLRESSLIPPNTRVVRARPHALRHADGPWCYVVMSKMEQSRPGQHAHAGIAWVQRGDDGRGLFIDLHDDDLARLEGDLHAAFGAIRSFRDTAYGPVQTAFASRRCADLPVCALVVAACTGEPW